MKSNRNIEATYVDRYGDTRTVHYSKGRLSVKQETKTVFLSLCQPIARKIGNKIKERRLQQGLTLEQLCIRAGIASSTPKSRMYEIENASRGQGIKLGTIYALARALSCQPQDLMPSLEEALEDGDIVEETTPILRVAK